MKTKAVEIIKEQIDLFSFGNVVISKEGLIVLITKEPLINSQVFEGVVLCGKFDTGTIDNNFIKERFTQFEGAIKFEL